MPQETLSQRNSPMKNANNHTEPLLEMEFIAPKQVDRILLVLRIVFLLTLGHRPCCV